jgi:hypothetical protein
LHLRLGTLAFCDIPDHGQYQPLLLDLYRAQHDVDRKRGAIRAPGDKIEACTHRPHARL